MAATRLARRSPVSSNGCGWSSCCGSAVGLVRSAVTGRLRGFALGRLEGAGAAGAAVATGLATGCATGAALGSLGPKRKVPGTEGFVIGGTVVQLLPPYECSQCPGDFKSNSLRSEPMR